MAAGIKANAGSHVYPDNETIADEVNRGAVAFGVVNQYYWYRMRAEIGASNVHSQDHLLRPAIPATSSTSPRRRYSRRAKHQAAAQKFLAFLVSEQGQEIIAHSISFEYPIASGVATAQPETPFEPARNRTTSPSPNSATAPTAIALLKDAGLL